MGDDTLGMTYEMRRQARGAEPPPRERRWRKRLLWASVVLVCAAGLTGTVLVWRTVTRVATVRAEVRGAVIPLSPRMDGRLLERHVEPGDHVDKDQPLAQLDDSEVQAALSGAEADQAIRESAYAQAQAGWKLTEARVKVDIELARCRVAVAAASVASAEAAVDLREAQLAEEIRRAEATTKESRAWLVRLKKGTREELIKAAEARLATAKALVALYELEVRQSEELVLEGIDSTYILAVRKTRLATQRNAVQEAELEVERLQAGPVQEEITAAEHGVAAREAALALARTGTKEMAGLEAQLAMRRAELSEAEAELKRAEARQGEIGLAEEQAKAAAAELTKAKALVEERRLAVTHTCVRSSVSGTVVRTRGRAGEVWRMGVPMILVADESKGLWVEGYVREKDVVRVKEGQPAKVKVRAVSWRYVDAEVVGVGSQTYSFGREKLNPFAERSEESQPGLVWVKLKLVEAMNERPRPGMTAHAVIRVR